MISYTGEECIVCKQKFKDGDDIVACPECGTPYHRACWKEKNECVNYALHEAGGSWAANAKKNSKANFLSGVKKVCPECSFINPDDAELCRNCGTDLTNRECKTIDLSDQKVVRIELDADADYFGMNPMEVMDEGSGITIGEMADYAKFNKLYYMLTFKRLKDAAVKLSVNFIAVLFPEVYFASRKMYIQALIMVLLRFLFFIPVCIYQYANMGDAMAEAMNTYPMLMTADYAEYMEKFIQFCADHSFSERTVNFIYAFGIAIRVAVGLLANELYFKHTLSKLKKLRKTTPDYLRYRNVIKTCGGISVVGIIAVFLTELFLWIMLVMTLAVLSY